MEAQRGAWRDGWPDVRLLRFSAVSQDCSVWNQLWGSPQRASVYCIILSQYASEVLSNFALAHSA